MVRLKEVSLYTLYTFNFISIPYGAIKSKNGMVKAEDLTPFQFLMVRLKVIDLLNLPVAFIIFQFLMVRLKDYMCTPQIVRSLISIPYGAIKSSHLAL